jgi:GNAT superfamily N-acetyltransferase
VSNITCRLLSNESIDLIKFKEFHNLLFKNTDMSYEWLSWYIHVIGGMHKHEGHETRIWGMFDDEKLIGTWCVEPKDFIDDNNHRLKIGRCFSVGIHPDYRRRNLFVELSKFAIEQERTLKKYDYILGFPQHGRPVIDAHYKSGWYNVQDIQMYTCKPDKMVDSRRSDYTLISRFTNSTKTSGRFYEKIAYKKAKWLNHPDNHYICLSVNKEDCESYMILKPYADSCHILDSHGSIEDTTTLYNVAKSLAYRHKWFELTSWWADNSIVELNLENIGFTKNCTRGTSVTLIAVNINAEDNFKMKNCNFQMGVEEIY